jgi:putative toxin-antitoxin system antitoxin component (TIGR02293 family)
MTVKTKTRSVLTDYEKHLDDRLWLVEESIAGIPVSAVYELIGVTHLKKEFIARMLNISSKTLDRYRLIEKRLTPAASELMLRLFSLYKQGEKIFGNSVEFQKWVEEPAYGLGYKVPKSIIQTSAGIELVMDELIRIEFGDLA